MNRTPSAFEPRGKAPPSAGRFAMRFWSVRHARGLEAVYAGVERVLVALAPVFERIGWHRVERPMAGLEKLVKGALFDCRMCGQCALSTTGMSCPMNCPKGLRNGPCGGVRANGNCEVYSEMPCVWVKAYEGSLSMREGGRIADPQPAIDHRLKGRSSWLAVAREKGAAREAVPAKERA
jgi:Methylene-tetrahydrofolate reductase C terminal